MNLKEAIQILKENHYKIKSPLLNESEIRSNTADDYLAYRSKLINSSWAQNTVQIGCQNTILSEKELNATGKDIGEIVIERYCKDFESLIEHFMVDIFNYDKRLFNNRLSCLGYCFSVVFIETTIMAKTNKTIDRIQHDLIGLLR